MTRRTDAAFSALAGLDPVRRLPDAHGAAGDRAVPPPTDLSIARITALSRDGQIRDPHVTRVRPRRASPHPPRSRYGALGLAASAGLAVLATLLWVSPSAGAPSDGAGGPAASHVSHYLASLDSGAPPARTETAR